jgi:hypothetical protein
MTATIPHYIKTCFINPDKPPIAPVIQIPDDAFITAQLDNSSPNFQLNCYLRRESVLRFWRRDVESHSIEYLPMQHTCFSILCSPFNNIQPNTEFYSWQNRNYSLMQSESRIYGKTRSYSYNTQTNVLRTTKHDLPTLNAYSTYKICMRASDLIAITTLNGFIDVWTTGMFNADTLDYRAYEALDPEGEMDTNTIETVLTPFPGFCDGLLTVQRHAQPTAWDILIASGVKPIKDSFIFLPVRRINYNGRTMYATPTLPVIQRSWLIGTYQNKKDDVTVYHLATQLTREQLSAYL